jgi:Methyltransferase domain
MNAFFPRIKTYLSGRWVAASNRWKKYIRSLYRDQHQLTSTTEVNRYPELFAALKDLTPAKHPRVLSYGCSTGEECASVESYLDPIAVIGADINESNLRIARQRVDSPRIQFIESTPERLRAHAPFHIILCLSVLCRWEDTRDVEDCSDIYPFEKFASAIAFLDTLLSAGGLLVIYNSNFRFEDTETFTRSRYTPMPTPGIPDSGFVHKFDRANQRSRDPHATCVYRKATRP